MPKKRPPPEIMEKDMEELEKVTTELKKREIKYPEAGGGEMIIKDSKQPTITYPEAGGGEMLIKKVAEIDTHRVELKELRPVPKVKITYPADAVKFVREMEDYDREYFKVVWLDTKNRVIGVENISQGSINQAVIHPRESAKGAILANAAGVVLIHNHPSGVPEPSREDDAVVGKLKEVFDLVGIKVVDALIIAKEGYYSYTAQGRLDKQLLGGIERIMENDACTLAMKAAMETMGKYCGEKIGADDRALWKHLKQEVKAVHALAVQSSPKTEKRAEHTIKQIDIGKENGLISDEEAELLKYAVEKALKKQPYPEIITELGG
ncbi:MAG: JAB domain-containing protein [Methanolobus sp.]|uniref:JAB domain-containing protein n=1 Tax=Methanolobus sp. TaxID=1874737 RepID=UPI0027309315|nr:JAB domain-containing protein [Methanolobus sp.]MDP2217178.1 JAB domain-containing protein [Methanolobus sp.]